MLVPQRHPSLQPVVGISLSVFPKVRKRDVMSVKTSPLTRSSYHAGADFEKLRRIYESDPRLKVPAEIRSYTPQGPQLIKIGAM